MRRSPLPPSWEEAGPSVNLTPLIDVVFVVLIMFIVVAPLLEMEEIQLSPAPSTPLTSPFTDPSPLLIEIQEDNTIWYQKRPLTLIELQQVLQWAHQHHPQEPLQLMQDRRAQFGRYQEVKNLAEEAGYTTMELLLSPL